ncbi:hypothetical protein [Catelliglobosispora koreensis]|uniref:hypothetical protein n=1 Tax=Catelliglobosispora koreensis TaxID=129052 RepID=UPI00035DE15C|nr:hypothetical protein [Catelliglobosispora koreensis]
MDDTKPVLMTLEREVIDSGRSFRISATTMPDGHTSILLRSGSLDDPGTHELSGVIAREDLPILARILKPELASIAAWQGISLDERAHTMAQRRRDHPKAYTLWTTAEQESLMEMAEAGKTIAQIAKALGRSPKAIALRLEETS